MTKQDIEYFWIVIVPFVWLYQAYRWVLSMLKRPLLFVLGMFYFRRTVRDYGLIFFVNLTVYMIFDLLTVAVLLGFYWIVRMIVINS